MGNPTWFYPKLQQEKKNNELGWHKKRQNNIPIHSDILQCAINEFFNKHLCGLCVRRLIIKNYNFPELWKKWFLKAFSWGGDGGLPGDVTSVMAQTSAGT